jgi:CHAT domain
VTALIIRIPILMSRPMVFLAIFCVAIMVSLPPRSHAMTVGLDEWPGIVAGASGAGDALKQFSNSSVHLLKTTQEPKPKYQWLFKEPQSSQSDVDYDNAKLLEKLDREVRDARKLYLAGEIENSILKYRNAIDQFEYLLDDTPPAHPLLKDLEQRFSLFEEVATKILGPITSDVQEQNSPRIFHLMEKRRLARRNLAMKKAGLIEPFDVPASLMKLESETLNQLVQTKGKKIIHPSEPTEDELRNQIVELRRKIQKDSPTWTLFQKGSPVTLAEIQNETLGPHELIMDFNLLSDRMVVGLISREKAIYTQTAIHRAELDKAISNLQEKLRDYSTGDQSTFMGHAWKEPCRRVYRHLIGKLPPISKEKTTILVIPDRSLWYTPFSLMLDSEDRPFGQDRLICFVPSADILKTMRVRENSKSKSTAKNDLLVFESIPWVSEDSLRENSPSDKPQKKTAVKITEGEKIERLILSNSVYPRPSDVVVGVQKIFKNFEVFVGPTATVDRFLSVKPRSEKVSILAVPLEIQDFVMDEKQPCFFFSPDKTGERRFLIKKLFSMPMYSGMTVLPIAWFEIRDPDNSNGDGPLLTCLALLYSGSRISLINYSDPNWGSEQPFLTTVLKKVAAKETPIQALADAPRELPSGMDSSFNGKPPSWSGWILLGDPER